jgi:hypothetical protein
MWCFSDLHRPKMGKTSSAVYRTHGAVWGIYVHVFVSLRPQLDLRAAAY